MPIGFFACLRYRQGTWTGRAVLGTPCKSRSIQRTTKEHPMLSRRIIAITIALTALLAGGIASAHAQEASPASSPVDMPPVLLAWLDAFSVGDPEAFADLYTEDGVFEDVPNGVVATGHEEIAAAIAPVFASVSESNAEAIGGFQAGNQVAMEY